MAATDLAAVLRHYPTAVSGCRWQPLGSAGGLSGAVLWCGDGEGDTSFCLKRWPEGTTDHLLHRVHHWMGVARDSGLAFVPRVIPTRAGEGVVTDLGHNWDVTDWMPGTADLTRSGATELWAAALTALAHLHRAWATTHAEFGPAPGVRRRLDLLDDWERTITAGSFARLPAADRELMDQMRRLTATRVEWCRRELIVWATVRVHLIPCLCDPRPDHFLFRNGDIGGVIDYGAMKVDTPAVDLARLLADGSGPRGANSALDFTAYSAAGPPSPVPDTLVRVLAETGVVCAVANWQLRLADRPPPPNFAAVRERLHGLVRVLQPS